MTTPTFTPNTVLCRVETVMSSEVGDETMMMDIDRGMYYALNPVSSRIWALLKQPLSAQAICEQLLKEYEIEPSVCEREVIEFLSELLDRKIITVAFQETDASSNVDK